MMNDERATATLLNHRIWHKRYDGLIQAFVENEVERHADRIKGIAESDEDKRLRLLALFVLVMSIPYGVVGSDLLIQPLSAHEVHGTLILLGLGLRHCRSDEV